MYVYVCMYAFDMPHSTDLENISRTQKPSRSGSAVKLHLGHYYLLDAVLEIQPLTSSRRHLSLDCFVFVLFAFVAFGLVYPVLRQEIGWGERLGNDLFCAE